MPDHTTKNTHKKLDPKSVVRESEFKRKPINRGDPTSVVRESEILKAKRKKSAKKKLKGIFK